MNAEKKCDKNMFVKRAQMKLKSDSSDKSDYEAKACECYTY